MANSYKTISTLTRTPSPAQIISYIVISLETAIFYAMLMNSFAQQSAKIGFTVVYSCSVLAVFVTTLICSAMDPSDNTMIAYKNGQRTSFSNRLNQLLFCDYCDSYVQISSRHCRQCNRCVSNFDHHCIWINNCIGQKNYKIFIAMIVSTCSNMIIFLTAVIVISVQNRWYDFLGFMITSWSVAFFVFILTVLLINLILLHIYLICKGYTTYQFIIARRQDERKKQLQKMEQQAKKKEDERKKKLDKIKSVRQVRVRENIQDEVIKQEVGIMNEEHSNYNSAQKIMSLKQNPDKTKVRTEQDDNNLIQQSGNMLKINENSSERKSMKSQGYKVNQFITNQNIFGQSDSNMDAISLKLDPIDPIDAEYNNSKDVNIQSKENPGPNAKNKGINRKSTDQYAENTDEDNEGISMSQFFTRNKSLSFLIGKELATRPKKKRDMNISAYVRNAQVDDLAGNREKGLQLSDARHNRVQSVKGQANNKQKLFFAPNQKNKKTKQITEVQQKQ